MVLWLRALAALSEVSGSMPSTRIVAQDCLQLQFHGSSFGLQTYMQTKHSHT